MQATRHLATAGLVFLTGTVLLVGGVPRTIAALATLPGGPVLHEIQSLRPAGRDDLEILIASQRRGLRFGESGRKWTDLGLAQLLLAREQGVSGGITVEMVSPAIASLKTGLALAPANPFAWTRLAYAQSLITGPSRSVASSLRMALLTARYEPRLLFIRLELCLRSWSFFNRSAWPGGKTASGWWTWPWRRVRSTWCGRRCWDRARTFLRSRSACASAGRKVTRRRSQARFRVLKDWAQATPMRRL